MRVALQRMRLEFVLPVALALAIFVVACGSSAPTALHQHTQSLRWVALGVLLVLGLASALARPDVPRLSLSAPALAALLGVIAVVSTLWSVQPRLTVERAVSFGIVLAVSGLLAYSSAGRPLEAERLLVGIVLGADLIAIAGAILLAVDTHDAVVWGQVGSAPTRYRGLGENPNTVALLAGLAAPAAAWVALEGAGRRTRLFGAVSFLLVFGSLVASQSRGALLGAAGGLVLLSLFLPRSYRFRAVVLGGSVAAIALAVGVGSLRYTGETTIHAAAGPAPTTVPGGGKPTPGPSGGVTTTTTTTTATTTATTPTPTPRPVKPTPGAAQKPVPPAGHVKTAPEKAIGAFPVARESAIGNPFFTAQDSSVGALTSSGRTQAWRGAIDTARERPLLGYGFGTEDKAFVDRYFVFQGNRPENAFLGWLLQLGVAGLGLFLLFGLALLWRLVSVLRRGDTRERSIAVGLATVVLAGFLAAINQSYVYSAGNIAVLTFWVAALALSVMRVQKGERVKPSRPTLAGSVVALGILILAVAIPLGRHELHRANATQLARIDAVRAAIGSSLDAPTLTAYRLDPGFACLLYGVGKKYYALQLCFDSQGRLIESVDRRGATPVFGSVSYRPELATVRDQRDAVLKVMRAHGVPAGEIAGSGY